MSTLTVHNAEITTAAVEIQTLTISGKQVTLAVFRQLREQKLISDDGAFNGPPWGTVNYHPDKNCPSRTHYHVVWQEGTELRRCAVAIPDLTKIHWSDGSIDALVQSAFCANDHRLPEWVTRHRWNDDGESGWEVHVRINKLMCSVLEPDTRARRGDKHECLRLDWQEALTDARAEAGVESARRSRLKACWDEITGLPQLYIAV